MKKESAGLLMYRMRDGKLEVLLVHPGGPWWHNKELGVWTIPKGEIEPGENALDAAQREFKEELGFEATGPFLPLGSIKQKAGKIVHAWAFCGDCNPTDIRSNLIRIEFPPRSGKEIEIPEIDRAEFFFMAEALQKINPAQMPLLEQVERKLLAKNGGARPAGPP